MHTELYCRTLGNLEPTNAVRAIHAAWLQLNAIGVQVDTGDGATYDNAPALQALSACLKDAGHVGFTE